MIVFHCQQCWKTFNLEEKHIGKRGRCPKCSASFVVPSVVTPEQEAGYVAAIPAQEGDIPSFPDKATDSRLRRQTPQNTIWILGIVAVIVASLAVLAVMGGIFYVVKVRKDKEAAKVKEMQAIAERLKDEEAARLKGIQAEDQRRKEEEAALRRASEQRLKEIQAEDQRRKEEEAALRRASEQRLKEIQAEDQRRKEEEAALHRASEQRLKEKQEAFIQSLEGFSPAGNNVLFKMGKASTQLFGDAGGKTTVVGEMANGNVSKADTLGFFSDLMLEGLDSSGALVESEKIRLSSEIGPLSIGSFKVEWVFTGKPQSVATWRIRAQ